MTLTTSVPAFRTPVHVACLRVLLDRSLASACHASRCTYAAPQCCTHPLFCTVCTYPVTVTRLLGVSLILRTAMLRQHACDCGAVQACQRGSCINSLNTCHLSAAEQVAVRPPKVTSRPLPLHNRGCMVAASDPWQQSCHHVGIRAAGGNALVARIKTPQQQHSRTTPSLDTRL